jgi:hypothetical protein
LRNEYFRCTITRVAALGNPNDDPTDPGSPPATETDITLTVNVLFWNTPVLADYVLEP